MDNNQGNPVVLPNNNQPVINPNQSMPQPVQQPKGNGKILFLIICAVLLVIVVVFAILNYSGGKGKTKDDNRVKELYEGDWKCANGNVLVHIDDKNFNIFFKTDLSMEATYKLREPEPNERKPGYEAFYLVLTAHKRVADGKVYDEPYETEYQIIIDKDSPNEMAMANTITSSMYLCTK